MNKRSWPWLLLIASSLFAPRPALAQRGKHIIILDDRVLNPNKQSHHDLPGGLDLDNPQAMMDQRLQGLRELHQLQDQVQGLLKDPDFRNNIKNRFSPEQLRRLQEKMLKGEGLSRDKNWNELLQQASARQKLEQRQIEILRRWAERTEHKQLPPKETTLLKGRDSSSPSSQSSDSPDSTSPPVPPEPSLSDRMQEEITHWLIDHADDVGDDLIGALLELGLNDEGTPLNEMLRALQQPDLAGNGWAEQAAGLSSYVPKMGEFLHEQRGVWAEMRSLFHDAPVPSLPNFGTPSRAGKASSAANGDGWLPLLLSLSLLGAIVLLLGKMGLRLKERNEAAAKESWRLGSWPVSPDAVSTRQDVIRAFEYLALLCLGPAAGTCHHRALAERLAEQDSGNGARRQAAEMLAELYEQARYAPGDETLSQGELSDARHALSLLAGVTAK